jgi:hypothetical protein
VRNMKRSNAGQNKTDAGVQLGERMTPNIQLHRSVNSRLRRLSPPGELGRSAAPSRFDMRSGNLRGQ